MCDTAEAGSNLPPELEVIKDNPYCRVTLKAVLRYQIQQLLTQLSVYTEEESIILSTCVSDGTFSYLGTKSGKTYLEQHEELKTSFLDFCMQNQKGQQLSDNQDSSPRVTSELPGGKLGNLTTRGKHGSISTGQAYVVNQHTSATQSLLSASPSSASSQQQPQCPTLYVPTAGSVSKSGRKRLGPKSVINRNSVALSTKPSMSPVVRLELLPKNITQSVRVKPSVKNVPSINQTISGKRKASGLLSSSPRKRSSNVESISHQTESTACTSTNNETNIRVRSIQSPSPETGDTSEPEPEVKIEIDVIESFTMPEPVVNSFNSSVPSSVAKASTATTDFEPSCSQYLQQSKSRGNQYLEATGHTAATQYSTSTLPSARSSAASLFSAPQYAAATRYLAAIPYIAGGSAATLYSPTTQFTAATRCTTGISAATQYSVGSSAETQYSAVARHSWAPSTYASLRGSLGDGQQILRADNQQFLGANNQDQQPMGADNQLLHGVINQHLNSQRADNQHLFGTDSQGADDQHLFGADKHQLHSQEVHINQHLHTQGEDNQQLHEGDDQELLGADYQEEQSPAAEVVGTSVGLEDMIIKMEESEEDGNDTDAGLPGSPEESDDNMEPSTSETAKEQKEKHHKRMDDGFPQDDPEDDDLSIPDPDNEDNLKYIRGNMRAPVSDGEWHLDGSVDEADSSDDEIKALHGSDDGMSLSDVPSELSDIPSEKDENPDENISRIKIQTNEGGGRWKKKMNCLYCNKLYVSLSVHLKSVHYKEDDVVKVLLLPKNSKERKEAWADLQARGNFAHNTEVIKRGHGTLITKMRLPQKKRCFICKQYFTTSMLRKHTPTCSKQTQAEKNHGKGSVGSQNHDGKLDSKTGHYIDVKDKNKEQVNWKEFLPCQFCLAFFKKRNLSRHQKTCTMKPKETDSCVQLTGIAGGKRMLPRRVSHEDFHNNVLLHLQEDDIRDLVMADEAILQYGMYQYDQQKHKKGNWNKYLSQKLRNLGRLLKRLKQKKIETLAECMTASNWEIFIETIKEMAAFNPDKGVFDKPSVAKKTGLEMKLCAEGLHYTYLKENETEKLEKVDSFLKIFSVGWEKEIGAKAQASINYHNKNKPSVPDLVKDMEKLNKFLSEKADALLDGESPSENTDEVYEELTQVCLLHIALLNATVMRDVERMSVKQFEEAKKGSLDTSIKDRLGKFEQKLYDSHLYVEVGIGGGTKTTLLLTERLHKGIEKLISMREHVQVENDKYIFGKLGVSPLTYRVADCLRKSAAECEVENLRPFKSRLCKKHIATIIQVQSFGQDCQEVVSTLQDHGIAVDAQKDLQKSEASLTAKLVKLLVNVDTTEAEKFKGCQFGNIEVDLKEPIQSDAEEDMEEEFKEENEDSLLQDQVGAEVTENTHSKNGSSRRRGRKPRKSGKVHNWTSVEKDALEKHFGDNIRNGKIPGKIECLSAMGQEDCLIQFSWKKIKFAVYNRIVKAKTLAKPNKADEMTNSETEG